MEIKKILVPTDFSTGAEKAYAVVEKIASFFGARADFMHVIPTAKYLSESMKKLGLPLDMERDLYPKILSESEFRLEKAMEDYLPEPNRGKFIVKIDRRVSDTVVEHAAAGGYDIIIMGAKGGHKSGMWRGSTTEKVIRHSKIPVFSVDERMDVNSIQHILVPTDSSDLSFAAFPIAVEFADSFGSDITLYHVLELYGTISESIPRDPDKGELLSIYDVIINRLTGFLKDTGSDKIRIQRSGKPFADQVLLTDGDSERVINLHTKIERGISAHFEIENFAKEESDLVVMATHGYSGFARILLGSTAEKVVQYVEKPVITIRPGKPLFKTPAG